VEVGRLAVRFVRQIYGIGVAWRRFRPTAIQRTANHNAAKLPLYVGVSGKQRRAQCLREGSMPENYPEERRLAPKPQALGAPHAAVAAVYKKLAGGEFAGCVDAKVRLVWEPAFPVEPPMKPVSELLKRRDGALWQLRREDSVYAALEMLARHDVGALMVMEGGRLVGIFSERDYTRKIALQGRGSKDTTVAEIMTTNVITVTPSTRAHACMSLMRDMRIRHLPVVDGDTVLGMISIRDLMELIIAEHEATISHLETYIQS
jgi:predicted transcriptional regulator